MVTHSLIASDRVEGTPVVRVATGTKIGTIQRLMISKRGGKVAYAVLKFGGLLGFGEKHFPVPWRSLNTARNGKRLRIRNHRGRASASAVFCAW
jgi:hypothetical protein